MDEKTTTRRFSRACQGESSAAMRLHLEAGKRTLTREDEDRLLFWYLAWQKATKKYYPID